jgi:hypothetical protein
MFERIDMEGGTVLADAEGASYVPLRISTMQISVLCCRRKK